MKTLIFYLNIVILQWYFFKVCLLLFRVLVSNFFKVCLLLFRVLVSNFTEDQLNRYEMYRRAAFPKASIKRVKYFVFICIWMFLILYAFIFTGEIFYVLFNNFLGFFCMIYFKVTCLTNSRL